MITPAATAASVHQLASGTGSGSASAQVHGSDVPAGAAIDFKVTHDGADGLTLNLDGQEQAFGGSVSNLGALSFDLNTPLDGQSIGVSDLSVSVDGGQSHALDSLSTTDADPSQWMIDLKGGTFEALHGTLTMQHSPGDLNASGSVGGDDLDLVLSSWGNVPTDSSWRNHLPESTVGGDQLDMILGNWGQTYSVETQPKLEIAAHEGSEVPTHVVPLPAAGAAGLVLMGMLGVRRALRR